MTPNKKSYSPTPEYKLLSTQETIRKIESRIQPTLNSSLPKGTDGVFHPTFKSGQYGADHPGGYKEFVREHELAHAFGISGDAHGEYLADVIATSRTGHPEFIRGPFYRPLVR